MAHLNFLAAYPEAPELDTFAPKFFQVLGMINYEARESGNYIDGRYYKGHKEGLSITVSSSEETDHYDLPIWVQISDDAVSEQHLLQSMAELIEKKILPGGFKCAQMNNFGRTNERRIDYPLGG